MSGQAYEIAQFNAWLGRQRFKHKIVIAGNHDRLFERNKADAESILTAATYLQDQAIIIDGIKFYGSPWQPEFFSWAFNLPRGQALADKWKLIPDNTDVLITHGPPYGILDLSGYAPAQALRAKARKDPYHSYTNLTPGADWLDDHVGCQDLLERVNQVKPKIHCFGHIHHSYGVYPPLLAGADIDQTIFANACICDEQYNASHLPIILDI